MADDLHERPLATNAVFLPIAPAAKRSSASRWPSVWLAIESIVFAEIREGSLKHNGNTYSANTCKVWESFRLILERFYKNTRLHGRA